MELLLFDHEDDGRPDRVIRINPVDKPYVPLLARVRTRAAAGPDLRLSGFTDHSTPSGGFPVLTPPSSSLTRTDAPSPFRKITTARPPPRRVITPRWL